MYLKKFPSEKGNTNVIYVSKTKVLGPVGGIDKFSAHMKKNCLIIRSDVKGKLFWHLFKW